MTAALQFIKESEPEEDLLTEDSPCLGARRGTGTGSTWRHSSPPTWCLDVKVQVERGPEPTWKRNHIQHE